jgi:hypothetical protein
MPKHDRESIKRKLEAMKGPQPYIEKGPVSGGKKQAAKLMDGAMCGVGFKQSK